MAKKNNNSMTIENLAEMIQRTMASKEDLQALHAEVATKDDLKGIVEEMSAIHADVRYIRSTTDAVVRSDISQDAAIQDTLACVHRLEQKAGLAK